MVNTQSKQTLARDDTLMTTTDTMRKKAEFVSRCFIYILKCLRFGKCSKATKKNKEQPTK